MATRSGTLSWHGEENTGPQAPNILPIAFEYRPLFERLAASTGLLRCRTNLLSRECCLLGKLSYALCRLPVMTQDVDFAVSLADLFDASDHWQTYTLEISPAIFRAITTYHPYSRCNDISLNNRLAFHCDSNGYRHDDGEDGYISYAVFEQWVHGWETLCRQTEAGLMIHNYKERFDWHQPHDPMAWERVPSLFGVNR